MITKYSLLVVGLYLLFPVAGLAADAPEKESLLFGASMGNYWPGNISTDIKFFTLMKDAGITHTGVGFAWDNIGKQRGKYDWAGWDYIVDMAARYGIGVEGVIVGCPEWALPKGGDLGWLPVALNMPREECVKEFESFVTALGKRYAGRVDRWTFWNEPNGYNMAPTVGDNDPKYKGKIALYTKFLKITYQSLKKGNPRAILACGGMDSGGKSGVWLTGLYENGAKDFMDAVPIHPYTNDPPYIDEAYLKKTRAIMDKFGDQDKPIWINEYGTYDPSKKLIDTVFDTVKKKYPYVTSMMLHTFQDFQGSDGLQPWGLIDLGLNIKHTGGYEAFKEYPKPARKNAPSAPTGPCTISGQLTDMQLKKGVADAYVVAMPGVYFAKTDQGGAYKISDLPEGSYTVATSGAGFNRVPSVEMKVSASTAGKADFKMTRDVFPLGQGVTFDPAVDRADRIEGNIVSNGSMDQMETIRWGQVAKGWGVFNTVQRLTFTAGGGIAGDGLSQLLGHSGGAFQEGIFQVLTTKPNQKYRLTFWFTYRGDGAVEDPNNCSRVGVDPKGGEWAAVDPKSHRTSYGFPKTVEWLRCPSGMGETAKISYGFPKMLKAAKSEPCDLANLCDKQAGGKGKGERKWFKFSVDFVAEGEKTSLWLDGAGDDWQNSRKYFDEVSVVPVND